MQNTFCIIPPQEYNWWHVLHKSFPWVTQGKACIIPSNSRKFWYFYAKVTTTWSHQFMDENRTIYWSDDYTFLVWNSYRFWYAQCIKSEMIPILVWTFYRCFCCVTYISLKKNCCKSPSSCSEWLCDVQEQRFWVPLQPITIWRRRSSSHTRTSISEYTPSFCIYTYIVALFNKNVPPKTAPLSHEVRSHLL